MLDTFFRIFFCAFSSLVINLYWFFSRFVFSRFIYLPQSNFDIMAHCFDKILPLKYLINYIFLKNHTSFNDTRLLAPCPSKNVKRHEIW